MADVLLTQATNLRRARKTNCTDTSFDTLTPTTTEPLLDTAAGSASAQVVIDLVDRGQRPGGVVPNSVLLVPFGDGNDATTFVMRVVGWKRAVADGSTDLWVPLTLGGFTCTLTTSTGAAGAVLVATDRLCDTIVRVSAQGNDQSSEVVSPANDTVGHVLLDLKGCEKLELTFDLTGATGANCLYSFL